MKRNEKMKNLPRRGSIQQCQIKPNNDETTRQTSCLHKMASEIKNIISRSFALAERFIEINTFKQHKSKSLDLVATKRNVRFRLQFD